MLLGVLGCGVWSALSFCIILHVCADCRAILLICILASRYTDRTFIMYKTSMPGGSLLKQGQHVYCEDSHNMGSINVEVRPEAP